MANEMIFVLNKRDEIIGVLNNAIPDGCPYWEDLHKQKLENGYETFTFKTKINHPTGVPDLLENENKVAIMDLDNKLKVFRIKIVEDYTDTETKYIWAEFDSVELYNTIFRPAEIAGGPRDLLTALLTGTRWEPGLTDNLATERVNIDNYISVIEGIHKSGSEIGGEIDFRMEFEGKRVSHRFVDMVERVGSDTGKWVDYYKDLKGLKRVKDTTELATALIGLGKTDDQNNVTTFKSAIWSVGAGDPVDKPSGQDWVGDPEALAQWGVDGRHIFRKWDDTEEGDAERLLAKTWDELQRRKKSVFKYEAEILLLESMAGIQGEKIRKGDTITIKDHTFEIPLVLEARVLEIERSKTDPSKDKVLLGAFREVKLTTQAFLAEIRDFIQRKTPQWDGGIVVREQLTAPTDPVDGLYWLDTSQSPNVWKRYDGTTSTWIPATPTTAGEVGAETPQGAQDKADTAKSEAINTASQDATDKANTAESNAKTYTDTKLSDYVTAVTYNQDITDLQSQIDGNITSWFYEYDPTMTNAPASTWTTTDDKNNHLGDLFYNTISGYAWRFAIENGIHKWISVKDTDVTKALQEAQNAQDTADAKRRVFVSQPVPPYDVGDLWTDGAKVKRATTAKATGGSFSTADWTLVGDVTSQNTANNTSNVGTLPASDVESKDGAQGKANTAEQNAKDYADQQLTNYVDVTTYSSDQNSLQNQIDGKVETWFYPVTPSLSNEPAVNWTTNAIKDKHVGDLYFNTSNDYAYRFVNNSGTYSWDRIRDSDIQTALNEASNAQDTADNKRRVFVAQPVPPYDIGDLWANGQKVYRATTAKASGGTYASGDWQLIGDVTSQNTSADTNKVGGTPAGDMETKTGAQGKANTAETNAKNFAKNASNITSGILDVGQVPLRTAESGARIVWDGTNGLVQYDASGLAVFQLGLDGSGKFAGELTGATGTFSGALSGGSIDIDTDASIGNNIYLGYNMGSESETYAKGIYFDRSQYAPASITVDTGRMSQSANWAINLDVIEGYYGLEAYIHAHAETITDYDQYGTPFERSKAYLDMGAEEINIVSPQQLDNNGPKGGLIHIQADDRLNLWGYFMTIGRDSDNISINGKTTVNGTFKKQSTYGSVELLDDYPAIEMRGTTPYIDFVDDGSSDYDARLILATDGLRYYDSANRPLAIMSGGIKLVGYGQYIQTPDRTWSNITIKNGWTNYGGSYPVAQYKYTGLGEIHLRGFLQGSGITSTLIANLPPSIAPSKNMDFPGWTSSGKMIRLHINSSGELHAVGYSSTDGYLAINNARWDLTA